MPTGPGRGSGVRIAFLQYGIQQRLDILAVQPLRARPLHPGAEFLAQQGVRGGVGAGERAADERAEAGAWFDQALAFQFAVRLEGRIGVDLVVAATCAAVGSRSPSTRMPNRSACWTCWTIWR